MKTFKNLFFIVFACLLIISVMPTESSSQGLKVGFVNEQRIRTEYKAFARAEEEFNLESKAWEDEATAKQTELNDLLTEYEKQKLILSEDKKKEKEASIRAKQEALDAYTRQIFGPGGTAERKERELLTPILEKANKAIEQVSLEGNFDVVFSTSALVYIKPVYDITDKVLEQLDKIEE